MILFAIISSFNTSMTKPTETLLCPANISVAETVKSEPSAGWSVKSDVGKHDFNGVTLFDGPPSENASLVPDSDVAKPDSSREAQWKIPKGTTNFWVSCQYRDTSVTLFRLIAPKYGICTYDYDDKNLVQRFKCE